MRRSRTALAVAVGILAVCGIVAAAVWNPFAHRAGEHKATATIDETTPVPATPPIANFRVLTVAQTRTLLLFAANVAACLNASGVEVAKPVARPTRIDMRLGARQASSAVVSTMIGCGESLGGPPSASSLQLAGDQIVLYLPKQCLLDKKVIASQPKATGRVSLVQTE
jgi:hypothetical protein